MKSESSSQMVCYLLYHKMNDYVFLFGNKMLFTLRHLILHNYLNFRTVLTFRFNLHSTVKTSLCLPKT